MPKLFAFADNAASTKHHYVPVTFFIICTNAAVFWYLKFCHVPEETLNSLLLNSHNFFIQKNIVSLLTTGFVHEDVWHLVFNLIGIFVFGTIIENRLGGFKMFLVFFGALILSMFLSVVIYALFLGQNVTIVGSSGALMGLLSCAMLIAPFEITYEMLLPLPVMLKGWLFIYADMRGFLGGETDGISHLAHLLGFLSIALICYFFSKKDRTLVKKGLLINLFSFFLFVVINRYISIK